MHATPPFSMDGGRPAGIARPSFCSAPATRKHWTGIALTIAHDALSIPFRMSCRFLAISSVER
jgi:hypothetical protein